MYFQPYGDEQQLNLNWIINEIINLHKQLDPNYETPSFTQVYPYSNLNRLNLDWVLSELKALKELAPTPTPTELDIQAVAEALVALPFDKEKPYQIFEYISRDGEIWRAKEAIAAGEEWDETEWFKTTIGTDLAVLDRWINAINADLTTLQNTVEDLSSDEISDDSDAGGATVKESLNRLKGSLNTVAQQITAYIETGTTASRDYLIGDVIALNGVLYTVQRAIAQNQAFTIGTNIIAKSATAQKRLTEIVLFAPSAPVQVEVGTEITISADRPIADYIALKFRFCDAPSWSAGTTDKSFDTDTVPSSVGHVIPILFDNGSDGYAEITITQSAFRVNATDLNNLYLFRIYGYVLM